MDEATIRELKNRSISNTMKALEEAIKNDTLRVVKSSTDSISRKMIDEAAEKYRKAVQSNLDWNNANRHLYKEGKFAVISLSYTKTTAKGKSRDEKVVLGVVPKESSDDFISSITEMWSSFVFRLHDENKPAPSISNLKFSSYVAFIGWRKDEHIVEDDDIEKKHGLINVESAFKKMKSM